MKTKAARFNRSARLLIIGNLSDALTNFFCQKAAQRQGSALVKEESKQSIGMPPYVPGLDRMTSEMLLKSASEAKVDPLRKMRSSIHDLPCYSSLAPSIRKNAGD